MSRQKVVQCLIEGIIKLEPDGLWGFNSLCSSIYTTALLYPIDSWASVWSSSVGDMNTPWSGLCDNRLTQHWAARLSRICSDQLCNDGSIILLIHVHSIKSYIALIYEKRFGDLHRQSKAQNMLAHVSLKMFPTLVVAYLFLLLDLFLWIQSFICNVRLSMCCPLLIIAFSITLGSYCHNGRTRCFVMPPRFGPSNLHSLRYLMFFRLLSIDIT